MGSPQNYEKCVISSLALTKMARHSVGAGSTEVMGILLGSATMPVFEISDCFALPVQATETRVNAMGEAYEYIVQYLNSSKESGNKHNAVGWYHSHPGYGCFLSRIDIDTQHQNQQFQDPFVALVIDPLKTIEAGEVEIGAFRTTSGTQYHNLEVEYSMRPLDMTLLTLLDQKTWAKSIVWDK